MFGARMPIGVGEEGPQRIPRRLGTGRKGNELGKDNQGRRQGVNECIGWAARALNWRGGDFAEVPVAHTGKAARSSTKSGTGLLDSDSTGTRSNSRARLRLTRPKNSRTLRTTRARSAWGIWSGA